MDFFSGLYIYLASKALLIASIGTPPKLFPEIAPENCQRPYIIYTCSDIDREVHLNGASAIADLTVLFDVYADTSEDRFTAGESLRNILHSRQNIVLTDSNSNTVVMQWCELRSDNYSYRPTPDGTEKDVFCRSMDFRFVISEAIPTLP